MELHIVARMHTQATSALTRALLVVCTAMSAGACQSTYLITASDLRRIDTAHSSFQPVKVVPAARLDGTTVLVRADLLDRDAARVPYAGDGVAVPSPDRGLPADPNRLSDEIAALRATARLRPSVEVHLRLADALNRDGRAREAAQEVRMTLRLLPPNEIAERERLERALLALERSEGEVALLNLSHVDADAPRLTAPRMQVKLHNRARSAAVVLAGVGVVLTGVGTGLAVSLGVPGITAGSSIGSAGGGLLIASLVLAASGERSAEVGPGYVAQHQPELLNPAVIERERTRARRGVIAGGVSTGLSILMAATGGVLCKLGERAGSFSGAENERRNALTTSGYALVGIGAIGLVPSAITLISSVTTAARLRRTRRPAVEAGFPTPWISGDGGGVAIQGSY